MRRLSLLVCVVAACGGSTATSPDAPGATIDAAADGNPAGPDAPYQADGAPMRTACTNNLGTALTMAHGRLDGFLVAIVPTSSRNCNGDSSHVHLQVRAGGATYDVAVNVSDPQNVDFLAKDLSLPDGPWVEGWHPGQNGLLDYPSLGVHAADFTPTPMATLESTIDTELADANHVSIFMTGYGPDGGHLVHRNGNGNDGAIWIRPLGQARALMFHFATQSF